MKLGNMRSADKAFHANLMGRFVMKRFFLLLFLTLLAVVGFLAWAVVDREPLVQRGTAISPAIVPVGRDLLRANDPRKQKAGENRRLTLPINVVDEAFNHWLARTPTMRGAVVMSGDHAEIRITRQLPANLFANLRVRIKSGPQGPAIAGGALGALALPGCVIDRVLEQAAEWKGHGDDLKLARSALRDIAFDPANGVAIISYEWTPEILNRARLMSVSKADRLRLADAHERLAALLVSAKPGTPLGAILWPLMADTGEERWERRRAALMVLGFYLGDKTLIGLMPEAKTWRALPKPCIELTLNGRGDTAQHFAVSAAITAWAGSPLADAVGVSKELEDAKTNSGFSFADLAADESGKRFGQMVVARAPHLDVIMADSLVNQLAERQLVPDQAGLPEHLSDADFKTRYGDTSSPAYQEVAAEINRRIGTLSVYQTSQEK